MQLSYPVLVPTVRRPTFPEEDTAYRTAGRDPAEQIRSGILKGAVEIQRTDANDTVTGQRGGITSSGKNGAGIKIPDTHRANKPHAVTVPLNTSTRTTSNSPIEF